MGLWFLLWCHQQTRICTSPVKCLNIYWTQWHQIWCRDGSQNVMWELQWGNEVRPRHNQSLKKTHNGRHWLDVRYTQHRLGSVLWRLIRTVMLILLWGRVQKGKHIVTVFVKMLSEIRRMDLCNNSVVWHLNAGTSAVWIKGNMNQPQAWLLG